MLKRKTCVIFYTAWSELYVQSTAFTIAFRAKLF